MPDTYRTPEEIERDIEAERSRLAGTLDSLQDKFSVEGIMTQVNAHLQENGGEIMTRVTETVKRNPVGVALIGAGLAWLAVSSQTSNSGDDDRYDSDRPAPYPPARHPVAGQPVGAAGSRAAYPAYETADSDDLDWLDDDYDDDDDGILDQAKEKLTELWDSAMEKIEDVRLKAEVESLRARNRLTRGTEKLSAEARARVIAARAKALRAQHKARGHAARAGDGAVSFYERQPLAVGAVAFAIGAALGAGVPNTRREDELMGEYRDRLVDRAVRIYENERRKLENVARATAEEARETANRVREDLDDGAPAGQTAGEAVGNKVEAEVKNLAETAKTEAGKQKLGQPGKS